VFAKRGVAGVGIGFVVVVVSRTKAEVFAKVYCCWVGVVVVVGLSCSWCLNVCSSSAVRSIATGSTRHPPAPVLGTGWGQLCRGWDDLFACFV